MLHVRKLFKTHQCNRRFPIKESSGHLSLSYGHLSFYERLVGSSKMELRKSIDKNYLASFQLQTFLSETEDILNWRPLV